MAPDGLRCVTGQGFGVRELPLPLYLRGHAVALVPAEYGADDLDLTGADIPVLDIAAAGQHGAALWRLAEAAATARMRHRAEPLAAVGAGPDRDAAVLAAVYDALADRRLRLGVGPATRLTGWDSAASPLRSGRDIDGEVECYLLGDVAGVPAVGAVLRLARAPHLLCAVACHLDIEAAVGAALDGLVRKFAIATLAGRDGDRPRWLLAANAAPEGPGEAIGLAVTGTANLADLVRPDRPTGLAALRALLRRHGVRAEIQTLGDSDGTVVRCRLDPPLPDPEPGVWDRPDVAALRLTAPHQLSLSYDRAKVELSRTYHENSKMRTAYGTMPMVDIKDMGPSTRRLLGLAYRDFGHARRQYALPADAEPAVLPLPDAVRRRRSWAPMDGRAIQTDELAYLLRLAYGNTGAGNTGGGIKVPLRATPSAGGLYSTDLFVLVNRVDGIEAGIYYFHPGRGVLQLVTTDYRFDEIAANTGYSARLEEAAAIVLYVGAFRRNQWKYWERGYRTVLLDCGHLAQSVVITANALGLVAHPMIAFVDDYFNRLVGVDGVDDAVLYLTLLGAPESAD